MALIEMARVFVFGGAEFPDPDIDLTPEQVLEHYSLQYPQLKRGKINQLDDNGDIQMFEMKKNEFQPDG